MGMTVRALTLPNTGLWLPQWMKPMVLNHMAMEWRRWKSNSYHLGWDIPSSPPLSTQQGPDL